MLNIALFGPPGAGKGTQSEFLITRYHLYYISTGDILRREIQEGSDLGKKAEKIMASGGLVSDEIIVQIIEKTIENNPQAKGFLFDGFPRTYTQAYILEGLMLKLGTSLTCLISLEVPFEESVKRLVSRGAISGRSDDNEEVIRKRLEEYTNKTVPVIEFYRERGLFRAVDGSQAIDNVTKQISEIISSELQNNLFNIVIFGYPGSGRSSQSAAIAKKYGLESINMSKLLEDEIRNNTAIGQRIEEHNMKEEHVADEIVVQLIERKLENAQNAKGYIFKGFPRTLVQSYILEGLLKKHHSSIALAFNLKVPAIHAMERLNKRGLSEKGKHYDKSMTLMLRRFKEHEEKTIHVVEKWISRFGVIDIDGTGNFDEVFERISREIDNIIPNFE